MAGFTKDWLVPNIKSAITRILAGGNVYLVFVGIFALLLLMGIASGIHALFIAGTRHAYNTYRVIPVAILISTYIFFVVASTGICLISSTGHILGVANLLPIAKRSVYLSIVTIMAGFLVIGLEIENPLRMAIYNIISPNFSSNIWWMGTLYGFALIFLSVEFVFLMNNIHSKAVIACFLGAMTEIAANTNLGGVFAMMHGRPYWHGAYYPFYFLISALVTGCAFIIFFIYLADKINRSSINAKTAKALEIVGRLAIVLLALIMILTLWKILTTAVGSPQAAAALDALLSGPYAFRFWGFEVLAGMVIPFLLLLVSGGRNITMMFLAAVFMIFGIFFMRIDMVVIGQVVPLYLELGVSEFSRLHAYTPSWHEVLVVLGGFGFCGLAFLLGEKVFNGFKDDHIIHEIKETVKPADEPLEAA